MGDVEDSEAGAGQGVPGGSWVSKLAGAERWGRSFGISWEWGREPSSEIPSPLSTSHSPVALREMITATSSAATDDDSSPNSDDPIESPLLDPLNELPANLADDPELGLSSSLKLSCLSPDGIG